MEKINKNLLFFVFAILATMAILFIVSEDKANKKIQAEENRITALRNSLASVTVIAKAVSVYEVDTGIEIYGKNSDEALPLASLVKSMTVAVVLPALQGKIISLTPEAIAQDGDFGLFANEKWKAEDLARLTLIVSANDGAYALAENTSNILEKMEIKALKIGMKDASFKNSTGLDTTLPTAYASALDANLMAMYMLKAYPDIASVTTSPELALISESGFKHTFKNTNTGLGVLPPLLYSKTGYTDFAGGNLTIIFRDRDEHIYAVTILGSTFEGRFADMIKIANAL